MTDRFRADRSACLNRSARAGFSLLEIAIVLVIVGLIIGVALVGKDLLRASEIRSVGEDWRKYRAAFAQFQDKFKALPGDMTNATTFWGTDAGGCPTPAYDPTPKKETCNGDGSGIIGEATVPANHYEWFRAWQHLSNAGFIEGQYAGMAGDGGSPDDSRIGINVPASKITGAGFSLRHTGYYVNANWFLAEYGHTLYFGKQSTNDTTNSPIIGAAEAYAIDSKFDDGKPGTGQIYSYTSVYLPSCVSSAVPATATYLPTNNSPTDCALIMELGF